MHPPRHGGVLFSFLRIHGHFWQDTQQALVELSIPLKRPRVNQRPFVAPVARDPQQYQKAIPRLYVSTRPPTHTKGHLNSPAPTTKVSFFFL